MGDRETPPTIGVPSFGAGPERRRSAPHPDRLVVPDVDQAEFRRCRDLRIPPFRELHLVVWKIIDESFPPVTEHSFEEAHLQAISEVKNAKTICVQASPRIAETTWRLAVTAGIRIGTPEDPSKCAD